ncbi:MAG: CBS domain-containing protein [Desulfotalea sp.]
MPNYLVKDLMVPISEYAIVEIGTTLIEAVQALGKAQSLHKESKYEHRAVLVTDKLGNVVGKINQRLALKGIEPKFNFEEEIAIIEKFKFSEDYVIAMRESYREQSQIINKETLSVGANKKVEEFMQDHTPGEYTTEDDSLDHAIHKLVSGKHHSLLVTKDDKITGVIRIADVFAAVFGEITALNNP